MCLSLKNINLKTFMHAINAFHFTFFQTIAFAPIDPSVILYTEPNL